MKILVAGGAGYVGQRLCPHLIDRGHYVKAVDNMMLGNPVPEYPLHVGDLFNLKIGDLEGYDRVIFLAGLSNDPMAHYSPGQNYIQNTAAPAYLAYITKEAKVPRFIYASSASVYGRCFGIMGEDSPISPAYPYGLSKLAGERAVLQLADSSFRVIALRKGTISGYSPRMRFDLCVNAMYKDAVTKGVVTVNSGRVNRPILSMHDAIHAYTQAVEQPMSSSGEVYNILSRNYDMESVGRIVASVLDARLVVNYELELRDCQISGQKALVGLDFYPHDTVLDILGDLQYCAGMDFESDEFYNIRVWQKQHSKN